ncbi:MAG: hypothetical protein NVS3B20_12940 [Polyangiales bacterium]
MRNLIARMLSDDRASESDLNAEAATAGFELIDVVEWKGTQLVRELPDKMRGGGAYLIRKHTASRVVVQAPHSFYDEGSLPLACEFFQRANAAALFVNTSHRYKSAPKNTEGEFPADVAHARDSIFQAATEGALAARKTAQVVQFHGFSKREADAAVVLSCGAKTAGDPLVSRVAQALKPLLRDPVLRFPEDPTDLGATTNVQGEAVRRSGGEFLHIEIASQLRHDLLATPQLRANFFGALASALEGA